ncbi:MAG: radical SAM protein [Candidatus Pacearchaeota archaeon]
MKQPRVTLIELPPTSFGKLDGKRVSDIYTRCNLPARANPLLHAILLKHEYKDIQSIDPNLNGNGSKLTRKNLERIVSSDYLLLSAITRTIPQTRELAFEYKKTNHNGIIIAGGPHVTFLPEETLEWADVIVNYEGDETLPELLFNLENKGSPEGTRGVSYKINGNVIHEPDRELLSEKKLSYLPFPVYSLNQKTIDVVTTSRGCPYGCDFCSVTRFCGGEYRRRTNDSVMNELRQKKQRMVFFGDDNFASKKQETKELLQRIIDEGLNNRDYSSQMSINAAFNGREIDEEFLELYKRVGGFGVCVGFESSNPETLKLIGKAATVDRNDKSAKAFRKFGIWVHGMMIVGEDTDTKESLDETLIWCRENLDSVQLFAPVPLPGTDFTAEMKQQGRILTNNYNLYDGFHVLVEPKNFSPYELQMKIIDMHKDFYSLKPRNWKNILSSSHLGYKFGINTYAKKIIYDILHEPQTIQHFNFLRKIS